ncbi:MAG: hypothetical protein MMC33_005313 [Icmadophila ericetorum]|nr:hypothetical protein [Icmadophila ericetorum]
MNHQSPLRGACSCGRNQYLIVIPADASHTSAQVLFDDSAEHREYAYMTNLARDSSIIDAGLAHSSPLPIFLRIPLPWLQSTTYAFYPDENHSSIRRVFTPRHAPHTKRHFCGFCGTPLSYWSEENREEAEWVCVSMGSLESDSLQVLNEAGVLPKVETVDTRTTSKEGHINLGELQGRRETRGQPWFEEMIEGSELGRLRRRRGGQTSADGRTKVEWEVNDYSMDEVGDASGSGNGKRKIGDLEEAEDLVMREGH